MERRKHKKVVVFRPLYAVGGQELGYLPGTRGGEDVALGAGGLRHPRRGGARERAWRRSPPAGMLEVLPLTHIRGRSLHDAFVIVDEAQSLERGVLLTVLSRIGQGSRVVLTHDVAQRDNLRVGRHDGVDRGDRGAEGASALRARDADPFGAVADRRDGHGSAGGPPARGRFDRSMPGFVRRDHIECPGHMSPVVGSRPRSPCATGVQRAPTRHESSASVAPATELGGRRCVGCDPRGRDARGADAATGRPRVAPCPCPRRRDTFVSPAVAAGSAPVSALAGRAARSVGVAGGLLPGRRPADPAAGPSTAQRRRSTIGRPDVRCQRDRQADHRRQSAEQRAAERQAQGGRGRRGGRGAARRRPPRRAAPQSRRPAEAAPEPARRPYGPIPASCNEYTRQPGDRLRAHARGGLRARPDALPGQAVDQGERLEPQGEQHGSGAYGIPQALPGSKMADVRRRLADQPGHPDQVGPRLHQGPVRQPVRRLVALAEHGWY